MSIRTLNETEVEQVAGGVLPTQAVSLNASFNTLVATTTKGLASPIGKVAICCCACHCCGTHGNIAKIGAISNPAF